MAPTDESASPESAARDTERRKEPRRPLRLQVEYPGRRGYAVDVTESVSPSGLFVRSDQHRRVGDRLTIAISLPGFPSSLRLSGEVIHIREATPAQGRGLGLSIHEEEYFERLEELLSPAETREFSLASGPYSLLASMPRLRLGSGATPLQRAERLSKLLGGPEIWFKRDDLTGFAAGGNSVRKMELIAPQVIDAKATHLVSAGSGPHAGRLQVVAAAASHLGLQSHSLIPDLDDGSTSSVLETLGSFTRIIPGLSAQELDDSLRSYCEELSAQGHKPFALSTENSGPLAALAYVLAAIEMRAQCHQLGLSPDLVVCPMESTETMAGLTVASRWLDSSYELLGVNTGRPAQWSAERCVNLASEVNAMLRIADTLPVDDLWIRHDQSGEHPGEITEAARAATQLVARSEGLFLRPAHSGKAMAALIDLIEQGELRKGQQVILWVSSGALVPGEL